MNFCDRSIKHNRIAKCKYCSKVTTNTGTKMCDRCWEIDHRIRLDFPLARKIFDRIKKEKADGHS